MSVPHTNTCARSRMSIQPPRASHLKKCSASSIGCTPTRLPMTVPRGIGGDDVWADPTAISGKAEMAGRVERRLRPAATPGYWRRHVRKESVLGSARIPDFGTAPLRLLATGFGYLNFLGRSCREPFGGDQNASTCLISKQSEQLRLFLVRLRKR